MNPASKVYELVRSHFWQQNRKKINQQLRARLKNPDVSIISMNCTGGILYHDLGLRFNSPTINLYFPAEDFIKFCENMPYYLSLDQMTECLDPVIKGSRIYPVAYLGDIKLFLVHYASVPEAQQKWNERKSRIQSDNIVIIATDRDGMTKELKNRFEKLPYPKVMFIHKPDEQHPNCFYLPGYENETSVGIITDPAGWQGFRPIDQFDYVSLFNKARQLKDNPA